MKMRGKKRAYFQNLVYSKLFFLLGIVVLLFVSVTVIKGFIHKSQVNSEIEALKDEIARLEDDNNELSELLSYLESDEFIKQEGKRKFGLREPGERLVVIQDQESRERRILVSEDEKESELSNPQRWWKYFFN